MFFSATALKNKQKKTGKTNKIQWAGPKKTGLSIFAFFSTFWCDASAMFLQCDNDTSEAFQWFCSVQLQRLHSRCAGILRPLTECQLLLNNGTSWKASVVTVEFVRPHCFGGLFTDDVLRASGDLQKALMKKSKQEKKSQTQRKAYICHDGLSHYVKAVFFSPTHLKSYQQYIHMQKEKSRGKLLN